ncbi:MAG: leucine-rich repeat domain-containing protein [Blautia wexlerae]
MNSLEFAPNSKLTFIGPNAFSECATLTEVVFPASLEEIDDRAFYKCKKLSCISFPGDLRVIGKQAFYFCGMDSLQLPDSLEVLDESAFLSAVI